MDLKEQIIQEYLTQGGGFRKLQPPQCPMAYAQEAVDRGVAGKEAYQIT